MTTYPRTAVGPVPADTDLLYSDVEDDLRKELRTLLTDRCPSADLPARAESEQAHDVGLWAALAGQLGVTGLPVPMETGGAGAGWRETAVVLEELGRAAAPVPYLSSSVVATAALLAAGDDQLLPEIASGNRIAALALPFSSPPDLPFPDAVEHTDGGLSGTVTSVAGARSADLLLVPASGDDGPGLYVVDVAAAGDTVRRTTRCSLDLTRPLADVALHSAPGTALATGDEAERVLRRALNTGAALLASEQLGVAQWCLSTTVAYVRERHQFARPVGSFQAVKHRLADLWALLMQARAVARYAAAALDAGTADAWTAAALAKAFVSEVVVEAAETALQLHGGIGFTWEHPVHLYLKRAKSSALALGTADRHRATLARLVDLPAARV
ncbi:acyl-CoA dehydrogenase family protein [Streptomyces decoyicus]